MLYLTQPVVQTSAQLTVRVAVVKLGQGSLCVEERGWSRVWYWNRMCFVFVFFYSSGSRRCGWISLRCLSHTKDIRTMRSAKISQRYFSELERHWGIKTTNGGGGLWGWRGGGGVKSPTTQIPMQKFRPTQLKTNRAGSAYRASPVGKKMEMEAVGRNHPCFLAW